MNDPGRIASAAAQAYRALAPQSGEVAGATVLRVPEAPDSPMLNRIVGLGVAEPATENILDEALSALDAGTTYYVALAPGAEPAALPDWLRARGLEPGWGWMLFARGTDDIPAPRTVLRIAEVDSDADRRAFARVVRASYGLPEAVEPLLARADAAGWECWLACDGDDAVGAAASYVAGEIAYLGLAGTLAEARGKGAQSAFLATRIRRAAQRGCEVVVTETGERRPGRPSRSYRNIVRAGFEEVAVTANWVGVASRDRHGRPRRRTG